MGRTVFTQTAFFAPGVVHIDLRLGLMPREDHLQWQLEVRNAVSGELIAMESHPHAPIYELERQLARAVIAMSDAARAIVAAGENGELPAATD